MIENDLAFKNLKEYDERAGWIFEEVLNMPVEGECAKVPGRDNFDPNEFGVSIYSVSGQRINFGSVRNPITLQAITAVTSFLIAQDTVGEDNLPIGSEPSGKMYNDMTMLNDKIPHNPLINSGHLMSIASIYDGFRADRKFENYTRVLSKMIAGRRVGFNNEMCLAELVDCHKNYCIAFILQEKGLIPEDADISALIEFYTQICNIELSLEDIAVIAGTLANGGL